MQFVRASQFVALGYAKFGHRGFNARSKTFTPGALDVDLSGRHIVVTGATSGLGRATAEALGSRGATVHLVVRSPERAEPVAAAISKSGGVAKVHKCDISSLESVTEFAEKWGTAQLDVLVNNAGVMMHEVKSSKDGYELNFATNTLGTYALTEMLIPALKATDGARVVNVSSGGMYTAPLELNDLEGTKLQKKNEIDGTNQYARNKRHQVALTEHWAREHPKVFWSSMHPGWADTPGVAKSMKSFHNSLSGQFRTVEQGADTIVWLSIADEATKYKSGEFFFDREPVQKHLFAAGTSYAAERASELATKLRGLVTAKGFKLPQ